MMQKQRLRRASFSRPAHYREGRNRDMTPSLPGRELGAERRRTNCSQNLLPQMLNTQRQQGVCAPLSQLLSQVQNPMNITSTGDYHPILLMSKLKDRTKAHTGKGQRLHLDSSCPSPESSSLIN